MANAQQEVRALNILIPAQLHGRLKELAKANRRSMSAETQVAIEARLQQFADRQAPSAIEAA